MKPTNNFIALSAMFLSVIVIVYVFAESRNDPGLRMAALVAATGLGASLNSIASTMLTGKDVTKQDQKDKDPATPGE